MSFRQSIIDRSNYNFKRKEWSTNRSPPSLHYWYLGFIYFNTIFTFVFKIIAYLHIIFIYSVPMYFRERAIGQSIVIYMALQKIRLNPVRLGKYSMTPCKKILIENTWSVDTRTKGTHMPPWTLRLVWTNLIFDFIGEFRLYTE